MKILMRKIKVKERKESKINAKVCENKLLLLYSSQLYDIFWLLALELKISEIEEWEQSEDEESDEDSGDNAEAAEKKKKQKGNLFIFEQKNISLIITCFSQFLQYFTLCLYCRNL